jgi:hypothetical protein
MTRRENGRLSSRALALVAVGMNLAVCAAVVTALLVAHQESPENPPAVAVEPTWSPPETVTETVRELTPSVSAKSSTAVAPSTTRDPLSDYQQVSGPGGMTTYIPVSWPSVRATGPGAMQATDPSGSSTLLRYGGSATSVSDAYDVHIEYEQQFSANKTGFVSLRMERTTVRGMSAVDWEFEYDASDGRRHVHSVYWLARGYEYFVYASSLVPQWPQTQEILDVMLDNATP